MSPTFLTDKESVQIQVVFSSIQSYSALPKFSNGNAVALWVDLQLITVFIIWQAPRAGNMNQILRSDWLSARASWSDTASPGLPVLFLQ